MRTRQSAHHRHERQELPLSELTWLDEATREEVKERIYPGGEIPTEEQRKVGKRDRRGHGSDASKYACDPQRQSLVATAHSLQARQNQSPAQWCRRGEARVRSRLAQTSWAALTRSLLSSSAANTPRQTQLGMASTSPSGVMKTARQSCRSRSGPTRRQKATSPST